MNREAIIKDLIKKKGMSIKTFSEFAGLPYTTLHSMLERGIGKASVDNVILVCKALGVSIEDLENMANESNTSKIQNIAAHAVNDLTEEEQEKLIEFAEFLKQQRSKKE